MRIGGSYGAVTWSVRSRMARPLVMGMGGMVAAGHYLASLAGMRVLAAGGNAADAGVAAGLALNVVHNDMCTLSGVAPIILYTVRTHRVTTIAGIGTWPRAASREYFMREKGGTIPADLSRCVVPAAADAWLTALRDYGTWSFEDVSRDAIRLAEEGFPAHHFMVHSIREFLKTYQAYPANREIYLRGGQPPQVGDVIVQRELATTLRAMVEAERMARRGGRERALDGVRDYFYRGPIAKVMAAFSKANGGLLDEDDLANYHVREEPAIRVAFRGYEVFGCGPWSQGPVFIETLGILERTDIGGAAHNSADAIHATAEALKLAFADRERYCGDPRFVDVPIADILSEAYLDARRARIDPQHAALEVPPAGEIPGFPRPKAAGWARSGHAAPEIPGTSYVAVIDREGNIFSATPSDGYSQGPVIPGLGLHLSERGAQSSLDPASPNVVAPGKRPRLTPNPALILREDVPFAAIGSPGNDRQPQAMVQVLLNMLVWGMNPQEAVEQPRFASYSFPASSFPHRYEPGKLRVEGGIPDDVVAALCGRGHDVDRWPHWSWSAGGVCVVMRHLDTGVFAGGADPRREGYVATF